MKAIHLMACCVSVGALISTESAFAQATSPDTSANQRSAEMNSGMGDIIVTARRIQENIQDIPLAVTALSGDSLENSGVRNISDLSGVAPNLNVKNTPGDPTALIVTIRGQGVGDNLLTIDNPVGIYIDGVNVPRIYGLTAALIDIERIEVLRGPQGTLYGRNTTGGAFSIITKDPKPELGGSVEVTGGNYDLWGVKGVLSVPVSDTAGFRFVAQRTKRDGFVENRDGYDLLSDNSQYYRAKFKGEFGRFSASITADYAKIQTGGSAGNLSGLTPATDTLPEGGATTLQAAAELNISIPEAVLYLRNLIDRPKFYSSAGVGDTGTSVKSRNVAATLEYEITDDITLRSISGYRHFDRVNLQDQEGSPILLLTPYQTTRDTSYSEEVQFLGGNSDLNWVIGGFYSDETGHELSITEVTPDIGNSGFSQTQDSDIKAKSLAAFAQLNWRFAPRWSLTAGARYTTERKTLVSRNNNIFGCAVPVELRQDAAVCQARLSDKYSDPSWLASIQYELTDNARVYGKFSRGFRGGGQNLRGSGSVESFAPFAPETLTEYEIGFKSELFDRRLRLNLAYYYDDYTDVQRNALIGSPGGGVATVVTNAASARLQGFEGEAMFRPTDQLTLNASVGYLDAKYKTFTDLTGDRRNEPWPAPDWTVVLGARYVQPTSFGDLAVQVDYAWQDDQSLYPSASLQDQVTQKAYGLLSGRISLTEEDAGIEIAVFGRNLTGKKYYAGAVSLEALGSNTLYTGEPRVVGFQISKKFGGEM